MKRILALTPLLFCSCATIIHGRYQNIDIRSNQDSSKVYFNQAYVGMTPLTLRVKRDSMPKYSQLILSKEGFTDQKIVLQRKLDNLYWLNLIFGPGLLVDAVDGCMYRVVPKKIVGELKNNKQ